MRILLTHRYFWPDTTPYALMLRSIGFGLSNEGHEVKVYASRPSYRSGGSAPSRERIGDLDVRRAWVFTENRTNPVTRAFNVLLYCGGLFFHLLRMRPDVVTASTFPPIIAAWVASLAARLVGARFIYHMQDIHPEVSQFSGGLLGRGVLGRVLRWLDNQTLRRSAAIIVLSDDMAETLRARELGSLPIHVINNFVLDSFEDQGEAPQELRKPEWRRRVVFAGNLGRFQNLPLLVEGVARCFESHPDLELLLLGDGVALPSLKDHWGHHPQVRFGPFLPFDQAKILIAEADVGLVSLQPNMYRVAYPSKVLTYLGLGVPVLALVEPESELAQSIEQNGLGAVPKVDTADEVGAALSRLLDSTNQRQRVVEWHAAHGVKSIILEKWVELMDKIHRQNASCLR